MADDAEKDSRQSTQQNSHQTSEPKRPRAPELDREAKLAAAATKASSAYAGPPPQLGFSPALFTLPMGLFAAASVLHPSAILLGLPFYSIYLVNLLGVLIFIAVLALAVSALAGGRFDFQTLFGPASMPLWSALTISFNLLSTVLVDFLPGAGKALWQFAATGQFLLLIVFLRSLCLGHFKMEQAHPIWCLPTAGNLVTAYVGIAFNAPALSNFCFFVGLLSWLLVLPFIFYRIFFLSDYPKIQRPAWGILLAPPALAYVGLHDLTQGEAGLVGDVLFIMALLTIILLIALTKEIAESPFSVSWWGLTFPFSIFAQAAFVYAAQADDMAYRAIAAAAVLVALGLTVYVAFRTGLAWREGTLLPPNRPLTD